MELLIVYSLCVFFGFYVANHSDLVKAPREWVYSRLPDRLRYFCECAFCTAFWLTLPMVTLGALPFYCLFAAPPVVLLLNLSYLRLSNDQ